jgi:CheY-like chemotaxis protein
VLFREASTLPLRKHQSTDPLHLVTHGGDSLFPQSKADVFAAAVKAVATATTEPTSADPGTAAPSTAAAAPRNIAIVVTHPSGHSVKYRVLPRNLGPRGLSFMHSHFIYPGSPVSVAMPDVLNETLHTIRGSVSNCKHASGLEHEVIIQFDQPIDMRHFVRMSDEEANRKQWQMGGRALVLGEVDADLLFDEHLLCQLGLIVTPASNIAQALRMLASQDFDVVVVDFSMLVDAARLATKLRDAGFAGLLVCVFAEPDEATLKLLQETGSACPLEKPVDSAKFRTILDTFRTAPAGESAHGQVETETLLRSSLASDPTLAPLVRTFVESLPQSLSRVMFAMRKGQRQELYKLVQQVRGSASNFGFDPLAVQAKALAELLAKDDSAPDQWQPAVDQLMRLGRRVRQ